jgi:hypothetical protein
MREDSFKKALHVRLIMQSCGASVLVINKAWLDGYYNGDPEIVTQVTTSKEINQPLILMIDQDLTPAERKSIEQIFGNNNVIAEITFDPDDRDKSKPELDEALELYDKKYAKPRAGNKSSSFFYC